MCSLDSEAIHNLLKGFAFVAIQCIPWHWAGAFPPLGMMNTSFKFSPMAASSCDFLGDLLYKEYSWRSISLISVNSELWNASWQANSSRWEKHQVLNSHGSVACSCAFMPLWTPTLTEALSVPPSTRTSMSSAFKTLSLHRGSMPSCPSTSPGQSIRPLALVREGSKYRVTYTSSCSSSLPQNWRITSSCTFFPASVDPSIWIGCAWQFSNNLFCWPSAMKWLNRLAQSLLYEEPRSTPWCSAMYTHGRIFQKAMLSLAIIWQISNLCFILLCSLSHLSLEASVQYGHSFQQACPELSKKVLTSVLALWLISCMLEILYCSDGRTFPWWAFLTLLNCTCERYQVLKGCAYSSQLDQHQYKTARLSIWTDECCVL